MTTYKFNCNNCRRLVWVQEQQAYYCEPGRAGGHPLIVNEEADGIVIDCSEYDPAYDQIGLEET